MNLSLKQLETFVWVADLGSFRKAAKRLNTTQPNISSRIASLESLIGSALMERDAGSVRLTSRGVLLLDRARVVLRSVDQFVEAADLNHVAQSVLRLGITEMIVHTWLREFLKQFKEQHPNVTVELVVDLSANLEKELSSRSIDLAFQSGPFSRLLSGMKSLGTYPVVWVASPTIGLQESGVTTAEELTEFPVLTHARNTRPYDEVEAHFAGRTDLKARLMPSSNASACLHMTVDGLGVAALLAPMVEAELASGELVRVNYPWAPEPLSFYARYDKEKSSGMVEQAAILAESVSKSYLTGFNERTKSEDTKG